ncbi:MAG: DUF4097 family beta strand repeat-containing protein [Acidobacteriota bacterium]
MTSRLGVRSGVLALVLACSLLAAPFAASVASAQESVSHSFSVGESGAVSVEVLSGTVKLLAWDRSEVEVTGTVGEGVEELVVSAEDGEVSIEVVTKEKEGVWGVEGSVDVDLEVRVPAGIEIEVESISAAVSASGVVGEVDIETVSGPISVRGDVATASLSTVSGPVAFEGSSRETSVENISGPVSLSGVSGELDVEAVSGPISIWAGEVTSASVEAVSGGVEFVGAVAAGGELEIESHSGGAKVTLPGGQAADFELSTFSGTISNQLGPEPEQDGGLGSSVEFSTGGGADIDIETFSGNIEIIAQ